MPSRITRAQLEFAETVDRMVREGKSLAAVARALGVTPPAITYRLKDLGLAVDSDQWLADRRTGRPLQQLLTSGEVVVMEAEALR